MQCEIIEEKLTDPALLLSILRVVRSVKAEGRSIRSVAKDFYISFRTLSRYYKKVIEADVQNTESDISIHVG